MKMWIARDLSGAICLHMGEPICSDYGQGWISEEWIILNEESFPEVTFENSPMEVEIVSKEELDALREKYEDLCGLVAEMRHLQREQDSADIQWDNLHYHESVYNRMVGLQKEVDQWLNLN